VSEVYGDASRCGLSSIHCMQALVHARLCACLSAHVHARAAARLGTTSAERQNTGSLSDVFVTVNEVFGIFCVVCVIYVIVPSE